MILEFTHFHLFAGLGGGARGFNQGRARHGSLEARFRCLGGVDSDPSAIEAFGQLAGVPGTVLDLFSREQYRAFHGEEPPSSWREASIADLQRAAGGERPNIVFTSPPCKGFSGLLSSKKSETDKYQALNGLAVRGIMLALEAWADDPPELFLLENVPRIANRGRHLLDQITALLNSHGYSVSEGSHCCGEVGGLAQARKRFLLVARHREKVQPFLYQPPRQRLKSVGEVLGRFPLPGDPLAGPMHCSPRLHWKTWVRLALIPAGGDWRALQDLKVEDGVLRDYVLANYGFKGTLGVCPWSDPSVTVTGEAKPTTGRYAVQDPRVECKFPNNFGVQDWSEPGPTVTGSSRPANGTFTVADPRVANSGEYGQLGVRDWSEPSGAVTSQSAPGGGRYSVADPRLTPNANRHLNKLKITPWQEAASTVTSCMQPNSGALSIADPRLGDGRFNNVYRLVRFDQPSAAVTAGGGPSSGGLAIADPRTGLDKASGQWANSGHLGVVPWSSASGAVTASARHDNGRASVADPRLPKGNEQGVWLIHALDETWHRPFTTLELAALQGLVTPEEIRDDAEDRAGFELPGKSHSSWRQWIGNAVPVGAAAAIASVMGHTLLLNAAGETWALSATPVWARRLATAASIDSYGG